MWLVTQPYLTAPNKGTLGLSLQPGTGGAWLRFFVWCLAGIKQFLSKKFSVLLGYLFPGPLARESSFCCSFLCVLFLPVPADVSGFWLPQLYVEKMKQKENAGSLLRS